MRRRVLKTNLYGAVTAGRRKRENAATQDFPLIRPGSFSMLCAVNAALRHRCPSNREMISLCIAEPALRLKGREHNWKCLSYNFKRSEKAVDRCLFYIYPTYMYTCYRNGFRLPLDVWACIIN
jgi:hypothetical protein